MFYTLSKSALQQDRHASLLHACFLQRLAAHMTGPGCTSNGLAGCKSPRHEAGAAGKVWVFYLTKAGLAMLSALCETALYQCAPHVAWLSAQSSCVLGAVCCCRSAIFLSVPRTLHVHVNGAASTHALQLHMLPPLLPHLHTGCLCCCLC